MCVRGGGGLVEPNLFGEVRFTEKTVQTSHLILQRHVRLEFGFIECAILFRIAITQAGAGGWLLLWHGWVRVASNYLQAGAQLTLGEEVVFVLVGFASLTFPFEKSKSPQSQIPLKGQKPGGIVPLQYGRSDGVLHEHR